MKIHPILFLVLLMAATFPVLAADSTAGAPPKLVLAVGLEKIVPSYSGPAIRIKRPSDGKEQDIQFAPVGINLNMASIVEFLGKDPAWITTLYAQDGSGHNVTAPESTDHMPTIDVQAQTAIVVNGSSLITARNIKHPFGQNGEGNFRYFILPASVSVDKANMSAFLAYRPDYSGGPFMSLFEIGDPKTDAIDIMSCTSGFQGLTHNSKVTFSDNNVLARSQPTVLGLVTTPGAPATIYLDGVSHSAGGAPPASVPCAGGYLMAGTGTALYYGQSLYGEYNFLAFSLYSGAVDSATAASISNSLLSRGTIPTINIVADGDSITQGTGSTLGWNTIRYLEPQLNEPADITNIAIFGTPAAAALGHATGANSQLQTLFRSGNTKNIYYLAIGTNDIHGSDKPGTGAVTWETVKKTLEAAKALGYKTIVATILHEHGEKPAQATEVDAFNALARAAVGQPYMDGLVDYQASKKLGNVDSFYPKYIDDGVHPNDTGYEEMSEIAAPVFNKLIGP